ncbi:hypothetical protein A8708_26565 [Paenibacillus oryzisoli]|uniref:Uncharacterized protein n=1 Tax=Paenibacillus oryzisoli TaxID=1850517 RepID=A0A198ADZ4_9BACL|nr:hypothetical protein A8708_26565 [Paenibacillus oryzisoli]
MYIKTSGKVVTHIQFGESLQSLCGVKFDDDFRTLRHKEVIGGRLCKKCESSQWTLDSYNQLNPVKDLKKSEATY